MRIEISYDTRHDIGELVLAKSADGGIVSTYSVMGCDIELDRPVVFKIKEISINVVDCKCRYLCQLYREFRPGELINLFREAWLTDEQIHSTWTCYQEEKGLEY